MFDFSKALEIAFDVGKDFFLGKEDEFYDEFGDKERSGGFLGLVGKGARFYSAMSAEESAQGERARLPEVKASNNYRQMQGGVQQKRYTPTNSVYRDAIMRRMQQVNFDTNLQRMTETFTVRPTTRRGKPTPPGSAGGTEVNIK